MTVEEYVEAMRQAALLSEADDIAVGIRHLTVVTGEVETIADSAAIEALMAAARRADPNARLNRCCQGNDYLTFYIEPVGNQQRAPGAADAFVDQLATLADDLNPGFWHVTRSPYYPF